jgi:hypothetical protein
MNYYYPKLNSQSKATWVLDAIATNDEKATILRDNTVNSMPGVFWGLANNNFQLIKEYQKNNIPYYFTDMPYWNRWNGDNRQTCSWRVIPNALHCNWVKDFPNDRFKQLNVTVNDWRENGEHILVCPSSNTIEIFYDQTNWLNNTINEIKKYTDRPIKVRQKPRNDKTSGPMAAAIPFEEDVKNAWAVVTLSSIAGVEAACLGVPVFCHIASACSPLGNTNLSNIESPVLSDRAPLLNTLSYYQYTEKELKEKKLDDLILS